jgi:two-component system sensor histidine kinase YesM
VYREGDLLMLRISDNGVGISKEKLGKLRDALHNGNSGEMGYGMFNVNERIRLSYGKGYGLTIDSEKNEGTVITIKYPVTKYNIE